MSERLASELRRVALGGVAITSHPNKRVPWKHLQRLIGLIMLLSALSSTFFSSWCITQLVIPVTDDDRDMIPSRTNSVKINTMNTDLANCTNVTVTVPSNIFVPIFVMTRDRISSLQVSLESYQRTIKTPYEVIILDHNSAYPPMLDYLHWLKTDQNVTVHNLTSASWKYGFLKRIKHTIRDYLNKHPQVEFYVVTDPDISLPRTGPDVLPFYAGLLLSCSEYRSVGPALQISDLPSHYSKRVRKSNNSVYEWESNAWNTVPNIATWNGLGYHVVEKRIDTTFAMYRRNVDFERLKGKSLRVYAPYAAVHVDWYDNSTNLPEDKVFYLQRQLGVNNW